MDSNVFSIKRIIVEGSMQVSCRVCASTKIDSDYPSQRKVHIVFYNVVAWSLGQFKRARFKLYDLLLIQFNSFSTI